MARSRATLSCSTAAGSSCSWVQPQEVAYGTIIARATFDTDGEDVLRLTFVPYVVRFEGKPAVASATGAGWTFDAPRGVLRVRRVNAQNVVITGSQSK